MSSNAGPATATITSTVGPGNSVSSLKFTDVSKITFDFGGNTMAVTRTGSGSTQYYDYSAMNTMTWTITAGATAITITS